MERLPTTDVVVAYQGMTLQTTTMVAIVFYSTPMQIKTLFRFARTGVSHLGVPAPATPLTPVGSVISFSADGCVRGVIADRLVRRYRGGYLRNCMSLYVQTSQIKSVNCKVSSRKIHVCGILSKEEALATCNLVMDNFRELDAMLEYIRTLPEDVRATTLRATETFRGPTRDVRRKHLVMVSLLETDWNTSVVEARRVSRDTLHVLHKTRERSKTVSVTIETTSGQPPEAMEVDPMRLRWLQRQPGVETRRRIPARKGETLVVGNDRIRAFIAKDRARATTPTASAMTIMYEDVDMISAPVARSHLLPLPFTSNSVVRGGIDMTLFGMMARVHQDFNHYEEWRLACEELLVVTAPFVSVPAVVDIKCAMTNCRVTLPYPINKSSFALTFAAAGYAVIYDRMKHDHVSVFVPHNGADHIIRKRKHDAVQFLVFGSGKITITGPDHFLNRQAFTTFMRTVREKETEFIVHVDLQATTKKRTAVKAKAASVQKKAKLMFTTPSKAFQKTH